MHVFFIQMPNLGFLENQSRIMPRKQTSTEISRLDMNPRALYLSRRILWIFNSPSLSDPALAGGVRRNTIWKPEESLIWRSVFSSQIFIRTWSQMQAARRLMSIPGKAKRNHVVKFRPELGTSALPPKDSSIPIRPRLGVEPAGEGTRRCQHQGANNFLPILNKSFTFQSGFFHRSLIKVCVFSPKVWTLITQEDWKKTNN